MNISVDIDIIDLVDSVSDLLEDFLNEYFVSEG